MENEDPSITFDRVAGETAMVRQLLALLFTNSPDALAALQAIGSEQVRTLMEARAVSDVFIEQAVNLFEDVKAHAAAGVAGSATHRR